MSTRVKKTLIGLAIAVVIGFGGVIAMNAASSPPEGVGIPRNSLAQTQLAPCPKSPNCVSTEAATKNHAIEPFPLADSEQRTIELLSSSVSELPGSRSVLSKDNYLHFEFRSPLLRFVDDVEFLVDTEKNVVQVRSASRVGRSDFGVNRKRMEEIRRRYEAALRTIEKPPEEAVVTTRDGDTGMSDEVDEFAVIEKSDEEWRRQLTPEQYQVARQHGTERAFTGPNWDNKEPGVYSCVCCELPLFGSETKYESGTGWPSFWDPIKKTYIETQVDGSFFMRRTEVHCRRCKAHLGHVFPDGPDPTGLRYCMNGVAMKFTPSKEPTEKAAGTSEQE